MKYIEYKNILIFFYIFLCVCVCIYIYITESHCFRTEIHTTLEINYTSVKQNFLKKRAINGKLHLFQFKENN